MSHPTATPLRIRTLLLALVALTTGCATLVGGGSTQDVSFTSTPPGARVLLDGEEIGMTPVTSTLERKRAVFVQLELDGYETREIAITRSVNGWVWGNLLLGGLIGLAIDYGTGAWYKLTPEEVEAELARSGGGSVHALDDQLYVFVTLDPLPEWTQLGRLEKE